MLIKRPQYMKYYRKADAMISKWEALNVISLVAAVAFCLGLLIGKGM
jgi:hypothetical protein